MDNFIRTFSAGYFIYDNYNCVKNYKGNLQTKVISDRLELNIIHVNDIVKAVNILLKKNLKSDDYCLAHNKNVKISNLISRVNNKSNKKIKVKFLNKKTEKPFISKIRVLPGWKADKNLLNKIENEF